MKIIIIKIMPPVAKVISIHEIIDSPLKHRNCIRADNTRTHVTTIRYTIIGGPRETKEIRERALNPINRITGVHISILLNPQDC
jgi:hypothetical protein